jgi:anti-sigma factor RsiW
MTDGHVNDEVEAYALGWLDESERAAVDAHLAVCDACLRLAGQAEETVASLSAALPQSRPSQALGMRLSVSRATGVRTTPAWFSAARMRALAPLATAATLLLALGGTLVSNQEMRGELARGDVAMTHVVHSHFLHVAMTPAQGESVAAKVLFARDGSWLLVAADRPAAGFHVIVSENGLDRDLGPLELTGNEATLTTAAEKPSAVSLRDGTRTIATAQLRY